MNSVLVSFNSLSLTCSTYFFISFIIISFESRFIEISDVASNGIEKVEDRIYL